MEKTSTIQPEPPRKVGWQRLALAAGFIVLATLTVWMITSQRAGGPGHNQQAMTQAAFEEATGIRIELIGVTAAGGMVDFRFKALDPEKAIHLLADPENIPVLIAEDSGATITAPLIMESYHELEAGRVYYVLYSNTRGVIKPGTAVSVVIGDLRLEPIIAQ